MAAKKLKKVSGTGKAKQTVTKKMTASQRIDMLESVVLQMSERFGVLIQEIEKVRTVSQTLSQRLNASITATDSEDEVKDIIISSNIKELKARVEFLTERNALVRNDDMTVVDKTFVVGRDIDENGKVISPRVQFSVESLPQDLKNVILGKKLGDMVKPKDASTGLEITALYEIHEIDVDKQFVETSSESDVVEEVKVEETPMVTQKEEVKEVQAEV